ncbi:hypothetical protein NDI76_20225 [Halogeometricum sp. S1BR25-6]|uniref:Integral membrane protein n=1 Tax=Halogeometricum salsisoli TaxID=2950536 RepID=A0ABU2GL93_9EURY|nr:MULTISPECIES: hypothetical protein [Halogeometricum]MDS0301069.1 hypothetical protein [Halogeometricum sp. S1BR25-6]
MNPLSKRHLKAAVASVGSFVLFGVVTGLVPNPIYVRMVPRTVLDYLFLTLTAAFIGFYVLQRTSIQRDDEKTATAGTVLGFLAFGCPTCNVLLLSLFGSSALLTYFDPLRPLLGGVSVVLFVALLYVRSRPLSSCESCGAGSETHTENTP